MIYSVRRISQKYGMSEKIHLFLHYIVKKSKDMILMKPTNCKTICQTEKQLKYNNEDIFCILNLTPFKISLFSFIKKIKW